MTVNESEADTDFHFREGHKFGTYKDFGSGHVLKFWLRKGKYSQI